jgi:hypothetical protein
LMSLAILFHFLCAQHVSDINISIIRRLRLCCWITTSVVLFSVRCVLAIWCGWFWVVPVLQPHQISNTQRTENKTTDVVNQQHSRNLLMLDILTSETCWAHKKWNKIASDIKLVFHSSTKLFNKRPSLRQCFAVLAGKQSLICWRHSIYIFRVQHSKLLTTGLFSDMPTVVYQTIQRKVQ